MSIIVLAIAVVGWLAFGAAPAGYLTQTSVLVDTSARLACEKDRLSGVKD